MAAPPGPGGGGGGGVEAARIESALRAACSAVEEGVHWPALCVDLRGTGAFCLRTVDGRAFVDAGRDASLASMTSDVETLKRLAAGSLSPLTALATGRLALDARGEEREKLGKWFGALKAAGQALLDAATFVPSVEDLLGGLRARIVGAATRDDGRVAYDVEVRATGLPPWRVQRTYSEFRKVDLAARASMWPPPNKNGLLLFVASCGGDGDESFASKKKTTTTTTKQQLKNGGSAHFPPRRFGLHILSADGQGGGGAIRERTRALNAWLDHICPLAAAAAPSTTKEEGLLAVTAAVYGLLGCTRRRCEWASAWRRGDAALRRCVPYDAATAPAKLQLWRDLVSARRAKAADSFWSPLLFSFFSVLGAVARFVFWVAAVCAIFVLRPEWRVIPALVVVVAPAARTRWALVMCLVAAESLLCMGPPRGGLEGLFYDRPDDRLRVLAFAGAAALRFASDASGFSRAVHVYAVAAGAITAYVATTLLATAVLRWPKGHARRSALFAAVDAVVAPRVAGELKKLGSIWVKVGQYLSARSDVVSAEWKAALAVLQDAMPVDDPAQVRRTLREAAASSLTKKEDSHNNNNNNNNKEAFSCFEAVRFEETPLASASIAQVHAATLPCGRRVALKVQHRGVAPLMTRDIDRAVVIAQVCAVLNEDFAPTGAMLRAWRREIVHELDFRTEAAAMREARRTLVEGLGAAVVVAEPVAGGESSSERVLAMDFIDDAFKVDQDALYALFGLDKGALIDQFAHCLCAQIFDVGFFNADPHPGNVLIQLDRGTAKLCLLDWGWTHRLAPKDLDAWRDLAIALPQLDTSAAVDALKRLGYGNNQDDRAPERSVQFFQFLFRDTAGKSHPDAERERLWALRKAQRAKDTEAGIREKGGRKLTALPESFLFVVRVIGALRGLANHLDVNIPLTDIMAIHATRGKLRANGARGGRRRRPTDDLQDSSPHQTGPPPKPPQNDATLTPTRRMQ